MEAFGVIGHNSYYDAREHFSLCSDAPMKEDASMCLYTKHGVLDKVPILSLNRQCFTEKKPSIPIINFFWLASHYQSL